MLFALIVLVTQIVTSDSGVMLILLIIFSHIHNAPEEGNDDENEEEEIFESIIIHLWLVFFALALLDLCFLSYNFASP